MAISGSTAPVPRWYRLDSRRGFRVSGSAAVVAAVGAVVSLVCGSTAATTTPSTAGPSGSTAAANGSTAGSSGSAAHTALPRPLFCSALRVLPSGR